MRRRNRLGVVSEVDGDSDATISEDSEGEDIPHGSNTSLITTMVIPPWIQWNIKMTKYHRYNTI